MANKQSLQFLRGCSYQRLHSSSAGGLLAGQPFYEFDTKKLYVGGDGGNALSNAAPIKASSYDTVISNQEEFENWYKQLDARTYTGESVLILSGTYTRSDGKGLHLPDTLKQLHGLGKVQINITNFRTNANTNRGGIWYTTRQDVATIKNISVSCEGSYNVSAFVLCNNLINCIGVSQSTGLNYTSKAFDACASLVNCTGTTTGVGYSIAFSNCTDLVNCIGTAVASGASSTSGGAAVGFSLCTNLVNCIGTGYGFYSGSGNGYGFQSCKLCSNCMQNKGNPPKTATWDGTNTNVDPYTCPEYTQKPPAAITSITITKV